MLRCFARTTADIFDSLYIFTSMTLTSFRIVTLHYLWGFDNKDMEVSYFTSLNHMHGGNKTAGIQGRRMLTLSSFYKRVK